MQMLAHSQLWEDGISEEYPPFHSGKFGKGIIQLEDDSYPKKEARSPQTVCTPIQIPDTGDSSTPFTPGASLCTSLKCLKASAYSLVPVTPLA